MISKSNKFIKYASIAALAIVALAASLSSNNINLGKNILRGRAIEVSSATVTFDGSTATSSGTTNTTVAYTSTGGAVICKIFDNDSTQSSGYVGAVKTGSIIRFYESDGETEYTFEDVDIIRFNYANNYDMSFKMYYKYVTGEDNVGTYSSKGNNYRQLNFTSLGNVSNVWVEVTATRTVSYTLISSIVLTYNCVSKYQDGVTILNNPSQTVYAVGNSFNPTGMVVARHYTNSTSIATDAYTYYPTVPLTASDDHITIYSGGFSTTVAITVSDQGLSGTYSGTYTSFEFTSNSTGIYSYGSEKLYFSYIALGTSITFTYVSGDNTNFGSYRLFAGGSSPTINATGSITSDTTISVKIYNMYDTATSRTFTKA